MRILLHDFAGHPFPAQLSRELASRGHTVTHAFCGVVTTGRGDLSRRTDDPPALRFADCGTSTFERYNPNYVGGDIGGGAHSGGQLVFRPTIGLHAYATPNPTLLLCSASTPPGAGVHGMGGYHAAHRALTHALR